MASRWIRYLPVTEDGLVVGMVSQRDLIGIFATSTRVAGPDEPEQTRDDTDEGWASVLAPTRTPNASAGSRSSFRHTMAERQGRDPRTQ